MSGTITISLAKPVASVRILDGHSGSIESGLSGHNGTGSRGEAQQAELTADLEKRKATLGQACQTLKGVINKLDQFYGKLLAEHKEEIARLSVEIARKILMQKVQEGDYEIEAIVKEALKNAPTRQDIVVHLNPKDLAECQKVMGDDPEGTMSGVSFVADPNIGQAECLLETPKGIIESFINEHLERLGEALKKAE
ncbi:MAG: FliH/SctL family protein [Planctomycetota bacterium]|jgi:flagellar biosynthesis/type III secretory pathway protein FliH